MSRRAYSGKGLDVAGGAVSTLCAIHCLIMPLAAAGLATSGLAWLGSEIWEWTIVGSSFVIGLSSLVPAYLRQHRKRKCLGLFACGILSILAGGLALHSSLLDTPFLVFGAVLIVFAYLVNRRLCERCRQCSPAKHPRATINQQG